MRSARLKVLLLLAGFVAVPTTLLLRIESLGVGFFDQEVRLESDQPIDQVFYACLTLDEETRSQLKETAYPRLLEWDRTAAVTGGHFTAHIKFTTRSGYFGHQVHHPAHLAVLAVFADSTRACRAVELPRGCGQEPLM